MAQNKRSDRKVYHGFGKAGSYMAKPKKTSGKPAGNTAAVCYRLAKPVADELGLMLWDVRFVKEGTMWYLRFIIDKEEGVTIDDCVEMSRRMNPILDEEDPIDQSYCMEVESPGVERELVRKEHFDCFIGWPIVVKLIRPIDNQREFCGVLQSFEENEITMETEDGTVLKFAKKDTVSVHIIEDWEDGLEDE